MNLRSPPNGTLEVSGLKELTSAGASSSRDSIRSQITANHRLLDIDLSQTTFVDSSGLVL